MTNPHIWQCAVSLGDQLELFPFQDWTLKHAAEIICFDKRGHHSVVLTPDDLEAFGQACIDMAERRRVEIAALEARNAAERAEAAE